MAFAATIVSGVVGFVALFFAVVAIPRFVAAWWVHRAPVCAIADVGPEPVTIRGRVVTAQRAAKHWRTGPTAVVLSSLSATEHRGRRIVPLLEATAGVLFTVRDEHGGEIDVDPRRAELIEGHDHVAKLSQVDPAIGAFVRRHAQGLHPRARVRVHEGTIHVGDVVTVQGRAVPPPPDDHQDGDAARRVLATKVSRYRTHVLTGPSGVLLTVSLTVAAVAVSVFVAAQSAMGW